MEATAESKLVDTRGNMMLRAAGRYRMNVGDPNEGGESNRQARESDMPVVVVIPGKVKPGGAKGHYYRESFKEYKLNRIGSNESSESWSRGTGRAV